LVVLKVMIAFSIKQTEETNNPLNDAIKAKDLFYEEVAAFKQKDKNLQHIFYALLHHQTEFQAFFRFIAYASPLNHTEHLIRSYFQDEICEHANLQAMIEHRPIELAFALSLLAVFSTGIFTFTHH
jgi:ATP-dependent DNA helicase RecQ